MTCCVILKWFQAIELFRQIREQMKVQGAKSGLYSRLWQETDQAGQFPGLYCKHDLQGRFEIVLMFSTGEMFESDTKFDNNTQLIVIS